MEDERPPTLIDHVTGPWREPPGTDLSRILAISDGVFAFAMTLLVLNLTGLAFLECGNGANPPCTNDLLIQSLGSTWSAFLGYAITFLVIGLYWTVHHRTFRYIERYDGTLIWLNLFFLITIAFMPFVLEVFNRFSDSAVAVSLFAVTSGCTGLLLAALWYHASGKGHLIDPKLPSSIIVYYRRRGFILPLIFFATVPIAFVAPTIASYFWISTFPASILMRRYGGP